MTSMSTVIHKALALGTACVPGLFATTMPGTVEVRHVRAETYTFAVGVDLNAAEAGGAVEKDDTVGARKYLIANTEGRSDIVVVDAGRVAAPFLPKTRLGKALWAARQEIVSSGEELTDGRLLLEELAASRS